MIAAHNGNNPNIFCIISSRKGIKIQDHATNQQSSSKGCGFMKYLLSYPPAKAELWLRVSEHWPFLRWLKLETEVELQLSRSCIQSANQRVSTCILCTACTWEKFVSNLPLPRNPLQRLFIPLKIWSKKHKNSIILGVIISNFQHCLSNCPFLSVAS